MGVIKKISESETIVSFVDGVLGLLPVGGTMLSTAIHSWIDKNKQIARDVLLSQIRQGDVDTVHKDELLSMLCRFIRSVQEGVAKRNLILLARLISGIGKIDKEKAKAEIFMQYSPMLESLTFQEIKFIADYIKDSKTGGFKPILEKEPNEANISPFKKQLLQSLVSKGILMEFLSIDTNRTSVFEKKFSIKPRESFIEIDKDKSYHIEPKLDYRMTIKMETFIEKYGNIWADIAEEGV